MSPPPHLIDFHAHYLACSVLPVALCDFQLIDYVSHRPYLPALTHHLNAATRPDPFNCDLLAQLAVVLHEEVRDLVLIDLEDLKPQGGTEMPGAREEILEGLDHKVIVAIGFGREER